MLKFIKPPLPKLSFRLIKLICLTFFTLLILYYSQNSYYNKKINHYHFLHFGTVIQVTIESKNTQDSETTALAITQIDELLADLHNKWHPWRAGFLKNLNNNFADLKWFQTTLEVIEILELSKDLYTKSLHYFNPTIGKLVEFWGFHQDHPKNNLSKNNNINFIKYINNLPTPFDIKIISRKLLVKNINPNLQLDLSGFIKGKAMIEIKNILLNHNIHNALINIGGDIYIIGEKHSKKIPWKIAVDTHNNINQKIILNIYNNETISTSGVYARSYETAKTGKSVHHILDPTTGKPADGFYAVTVVHSNPYISDAAATALLIAGKKHYKQVALSMGVDKYILIEQNKNILLSPVIKQRVLERVFNDTKPFL
ncbi:MAG: FAD:protein FMN transferase [Gammaproteobacteria bacterium]|nr:FAD:protein FMN transferase [Gammaproteobacteria bacterium]